MTDVRRIALELRRFRDAEARRCGVEGYKILQNRVIDRIAEHAPTTNLELLQIKGIGAAKAKKYGDTILRIVSVDGEDKEDDQKVYSVGEFLHVLNSALEKKVISIQGEITECDNKGYASYVTLKDPEEEALLRCYIPRRSIPSGIELEQGMEVVVTGHPYVHKIYNFSIQVQSVLLAGEGVLLKVFEELKKKLAKEGVFDEEKKQDIPPFIRKVGLITSPGSDAERDVCTHLGEWGMQIRRLGVHVEGVHAVSEIVSAIHWFNAHAQDVDVIILTRGGGSLESLQAFNSEQVARAIFASKIPIICGVGHERDVSIADMVSDLRVSTPTHAGRYIAERWGRVEESLEGYFRVYTEKIGGRLQLVESSLDRSGERLGQYVRWRIQEVYTALRQVYRDITVEVRGSFELFRRLETEFFTNTSLLSRSIQEKKRILSSGEKTFFSSSERFLVGVRKNLSIFEEKLSVVDPELKLKQGYSIAFGTNGKVVRSTHDVKAGDTLKTHVSDGSITSQVE